jgi:hypothetical protein
MELNPVTDFMEKAKGLTRNPLGIIALFISLIYGVACFVLSASLNNLHRESEREIFSVLEKAFANPALHLTACSGDCPLSLAI